MAVNPAARGRMSVRVRRDWLAALLVATIICAEWCIVYGVHEGQRITDPVSYFGDAHFSAALVSAARRGDFVPFLSKDIPSLGAPFVAQWGDFPINEDVLLFCVGMLARPLGVFGAINVSFVLACVLAGVSLFFVGRRLHFGRPGSVAASLLYGLAMYVFARGTHHFSLIFYFFFPWLALVGLWTSSRKGIPLGSRRFKVAAVTMLLTAWSEIYYLYFGAQLMALAVTVRLARWGRSQVKVALVLAAVALVGTVSMNVYTLLLRIRQGPNLAAVSRAPTDVERFALKPVNFFTAGGNHRYAFGRAISAMMSQQSVTSGEAPAPYMGVVGGLTFLSMIGFLLVRLARARLGMPVSMALMALWFTFFHAVGGSNSLLGLVGMIDPPRPEAFDAIAKTESAGIRTVMITGDHPETAEAVARELCILKQGRVVTGRELDEWDDGQLDRAVEGIEVFARVSPAHKLRIVTALQKAGHTVAMTGDGVNDAPSLRKADIGIAMGITGTDVSRDAAAMTLTDDSFASIVAAVEEGRRVFGNIKKYLMYLLSSNIGEIGLMVGASVLGLPLPLTAVQILWVNLATDGLPALALAVDPPEDDLMKRRPRDGKAGIFTRPVVVLMLVGGFWSTVVNVGLFAWASHSGRSMAEAMSMTFVSLVLIQFFKAYSYRSDRRSVLHKPFANKWLNIAIAWEFALLLAILYVPFLQNLFDTFALSAVDWGIIAAAAFTVVPALELTKWLERRGAFGELD